MMLLERIASILNRIGEYSSNRGGPDWFVDADGRGRTWFDYWRDEDTPSRARHYTLGRWRLTLG